MINCFFGSGSSSAAPGSTPSTANKSFRYMRRQPTIVQYDLEELGEVNAGFKNNNNGRHDTDDESVGGHGGGGGGGVRFDGSSNVVITGSGKVS